MWWQSAGWEGQAKNEEDWGGQSIKSMTKSKKYEKETEMEQEEYEADGW